MSSESTPVRSRDARRAGTARSAVPALSLPGCYFASNTATVSGGTVKLPVAGSKDAAFTTSSEPLRWTAVNAIYTAYRMADRIEASGSSSRTAWPAHIADVVAGRH